MKKLVFTFVTLLLPMLASAQDAVEIDGIYYKLITKGMAAEITNYSYSNSEELVIPESVRYNDDDYNVTSIGWCAFAYCSLKSVAIPGSVTSIGDGAFEGCSDLTSVTIGNGVTSIGNGAFNYCKSLTSVTIPNSVTSIGEQAFNKCSGLISVTIPNSVSTIGECAFRDCNALNSVFISDLEAWCKIVFSDNTSNPLGYAHNLFLNGEEVKDLVIPSGLTSIGNYAFQNCSSLTSVTIPNSVTSIGPESFYGCWSLTSVHISDLEAWCKIGFNDNPLIYAHHLFLNGDEIKELVIPNGVISINYSAFSGYSGLTSVTIPNSVTSIGGKAFYDCRGLTSISIGSSVTSISYDAFSCCKGLTSISIPNSVTNIGGSAFSDCSSLTSVTIGSGIKNIYSQVFASCPELKDVYCSAENVPTTNSNAFEGSYIEYCTLHVPAASVNDYKSTEPWSGFKSIVALDGGEIPETPKCATPTISYADGEITFGCETEGVEYVSEVTAPDAKNYYDGKISLTNTIKVSVYAMKAGCENSDVVTKEIKIFSGSGSGKPGDANEDGTINAADIVTIVNIIMGK